MPGIVVLQKASPSAAPNGALAREAGAFANAVARLFPRPHDPYFAAEPARRRAMQLIAHRHERSQRRDLAEALQFWSLKRVFAEFHPEAPAGLVEALRKLEGEGWTPADYVLLQSVLAEGGHGAKTVRHAETITRALVHIVSILPGELRRVRIVALIASPALADLAARSVKRVASGKDADVLPRLADRLERARSTQNLFRMLIEEIGLEQLAPPPVPGADWFKPIATIAQVRSAALRFENCLEGRIAWLLSGRGAYYEVLGEEPAIVEIVRCGNGLWTAGEIRGHANAAVSADLMTRVKAYLVRHGAVVAGMRMDRLALQLADAAGFDAV